MSIALVRRIKSISARSGTGNHISLRDRGVGAYLGLAIGDALGATTEFMTPAEIQEKHGVHDKICGGGWLKLTPGQVTDDTEMSLALGESILRNKGVQAEQVAEAFSRWMRKKPVDIGNTVRRGIMHFRTTGVTQMAVNEYDAGNGACMRSLPIALYFRDRPWQELVSASRVQSHVTHNNPVADAGTETLLAMLVAAMQGETRQQLRHLSEQLVEQHKIYRFDRRQIVNPGGWIVETLQAVFQAFFDHSSFADTLIDVVNRGGDADTTGAIAGMLAGAFYGVNDIPGRWLKALDQRVRWNCESQAVDLLGLNRVGHA